MPPDIDAAKTWPGSLWFARPQAGDREVGTKRAQQTRLPRRRQQELEVEASRRPSLGYKAAEPVGFIRCLDHGFPKPLARWHYHDEYELHLIVATSVQFHHDSIASACKGITEPGELLPLLERSRNGIELFGLLERALSYFERIKGSRGLERLAVFCQFMADLAHCTDYRLLSSAKLQSFDDEASLERINSIVNRLMENPAQAPSLSDFAAQFGMTESRFSRFFRRATGNNFIDFVNRVRISRACLLLMETNRYITSICYDVGFNNVANFNRRFLKIKGMTPRDFRRHAGTRFGG